MLQISLPIPLSPRLPTSPPPHQLSVANIWVFDISRSDRAFGDRICPPNHQKTCAEAPGLRHGEEAHARGFNRSQVPGFHFWFSIYFLTTSNGAPPTVATK